MSELPDWAKVIAVFDTETTGVDVNSARIVTTSISLLSENGDVIERDDWLINPQIEIPESASAVHGITTAIAAADGMLPEVGVSQILETLRNIFDRGFAVTVYNAPYDFTILAREAMRLGLAPLSEPKPVIDPLVLDKQLDRYRRGKRTLTATIAEYGVTIGQAHDAGEDAIAAGRLAQAIARKFVTELPNDAEELHNLQAIWASEQAENFQAWMRANKDPEFTAEGAWPIRPAL